MEKKSPDKVGAQDAVPDSDSDAVPVAPPKKKNKKKSKKKTNEDECALYLDQKVMGFWPADELWYEGIVQGIDYEERTVHILYNDGDIDDAVPWKNCRILETTRKG